MWDPEEKLGRIYFASLRDLLKWTSTILRNKQKGKFLGQWHRTGPHPGVTGSEPPMKLKLGLPSSTDQLSKLVTVRSRRRR